MASFLQSLKFYFKCGVFGVLLIACALYGVIASIVLRIIGKKEYSQYTVARAFYYSLSTVLGIKIKMNNEKYLFEKPAIVISNHQSALDILMLGRIFQPGYTVTAKKVLKFFPFLGWFMLASGTFFIDRAKSDKARKVLNDALVSVKNEKRSLFMFPEGTRSAATNLEMLPFKKGAFHLAQQASLPVLSVVVSNYSTIFHSKSKVFNRGEIIVDVLPPMQTKDIKSKEQIDKFVIDVRKAMVERLQTIGYAKSKSNQKPISTVREPQSAIKSDPDLAVDTSENDNGKKDNAKVSVVAKDDTSEGDDAQVDAKANAKADAKADAKDAKKNVQDVEQTTR